jgi:hypothetical protein
MLLAFARQAKATAEGDLMYWTTKGDDTTLRARSEVLRARETVASCEISIRQLEGALASARSGWDVTEPLKSARRLFESLMNCRVRPSSHGKVHRRLRARSSSAGDARHDT